VEREFTYSTGAVEFLLSVGYSMDAPFKEGVPYLSRQETEVVRRKAMEKWDRASIPDIKIRPDDHQALDFMKRVRSEIDQWLKLSRVGQHPYVCVTSGCIVIFARLPPTCNPRVLLLQWSKSCCVISYHYSCDLIV